MNFRVCSSKQAWRGSLGLKRQSKSASVGRSSRRELLEAPLGQARAAPVELVLQHGGEGVQEGLLGALGLHHAGAQGGGDARQAQLAQGAFDLLHVHGLISVVVVFGVLVVRGGCAAPRANSSA